MEWTIGSKIALSVLLVAAAVLDLKTRRVPHLITWPLLLVVVAARAWEGSWILPVFLLGLILVEWVPAVWRVSAIVLLVGGVQSVAWMLDDPDTRLIVLWWGITYALWVLHVLGGADVRLLMALVALFPHPGMVAALWGGVLLVSLAWLVVIHRRHAWIPLLQAGRGISGGRYPSREDLKEQGRPTTPGLVLGALAYLWFIT